MADERVVFIFQLDDDLTPGTGKAAKGMRNVNKATKATTASTRGLGAAIKTALGPLTAAFAAGQLVTGIFNLGKEMEQTRVAFATFLGTAEKGNAVLAELNQFANVTPFDNKQVIGAAQSLLAFNTSAEELQPTLKFLGDIAAGTGKDFKELSIIYGQIRSQGKLMGQDLLQLINAGFNPLQVISEKTGKSVSALKDEMSKGAISFDMVKDAFITATSEGGQFFNLMEKQSQTVGGRISTLIGKLQLIGISIGEAVLPWIGKMVDGLLAFTEMINKVDFSPYTDQLMEMVNIGKEVWNIFTELFSLFGDGVSDVDLMQAALNSLATVIRAMMIPMKGLLATYKTIIQSVRAFQEGGISAAFDVVKGNFNDFIKTEIDGFKKIFQTRAKTETEAATTPAVAGAGGGAASGAALAAQQGAGAAAGQSRTSISGDLKGVSGGAKTINITIEKLIEEFKIETTNIKESETELVESVKRALLVAVNDVSLQAG